MSKRADVLAAVAGGGGQSVQIEAVRMLPSDEELAADAVGGLHTIADRARLEKVQLEFGDFVQGNVDGRFVAPLRRVPPGVEEGTFQDRVGEDEGAVK